jgi:hypothetical protein
MGEHETVAALAAQVGELRQLADSLKATVTRWDARLEQEVGGGLVLRLEVKKLREEVAGLAATLSAALDSGKLKLPLAPRWDSLDPDEEATQLAALRAWVDGFLTVEYPGYPLTACWPAHREALWELGALHAEWQRINADAARAVDLAGALSFHERWLPGVLSRLTRSIGCDAAGCRLAAPGRRT